MLPSSIARLILLSVLTGVVAGCGAIAFHWLLGVSEHFFLEVLAGYHPPRAGNEIELFPPSATPLRRWVLFILPALGGLISGILVYTLAPEAEGHGTDAAITSYHFRGGVVRTRVPFVKTIASALTIGTGGSGGAEGPIAQIGAGFGSMVARLLKLSPNERRILMAAGLGAGVGAIFHAPLAGALFAAEVLYKDMDLEHEVIVPGFIASIVAYSIFAARFGWTPIFATPNFVFHDPAQLLPYLLLSFVVAFGAIAYVTAFFRAHRFFRGLQIPNHFKPAIGGLAVGVIGIFVPDALGTGYGVIQQAIDSSAPYYLLLAVVVAKIATTAFTIGSGGSGGVFGPAIVIGGALGGVVGQVMERAFPAMDIVPGAFVVVGMAGFFSAAANCPISTLIIVSEVTGNYHLLVPSMLVCVMAYLLARPFSLYHTQLQSRLEAPSKMGNMLTAVLSKITVRSAVEEEGEEIRPMPTVPENMNLRAIIERFSTIERQHMVPVVNREGKFVGIIDFNDIRRVLSEEGVADLVVARDLAKSPVTIRPDESLLAAVRKMVKSESDELIVVDPEHKDAPIATLNHNRVLRAYDRALYTGRK